MLFITGGAGFIGTNFVLNWLSRHNEQVLNLDALTYAGNLHNLHSINNDPRHVFIQGNINDPYQLTQLLTQYRPRAIIHFAAESHVDRSIHSPENFIHTNIVGTFHLLETARNYWNSLKDTEKHRFRFLHISTDEVYGSLTEDALPFQESNAYQPNSPYSASKAASDHLVRAYYHTYGLPVLTSNCSNNYGPYQFPEKLIPLIITRALANQSLPIYGDGQQIRDWLYVIDHCNAIGRILEAGQPGETYNVGGWNEKRNIDIVYQLCDLLDEMEPTILGSYRRLVTHVTDRPGHDRRYAIDARKIDTQLGWRPAETFDSGLRKTVAWYLAQDRDTVL